jgi:hypothetical protein
LKLQDELKELHSAAVGNILSKKLILKASRTKHRVFNQYRIIKKYISPVEQQLYQTLSKEGHTELLKRLRHLMNKTFETTLVEQVDHQYLPKFREIFNKLDEHHRFTNYDDFEIVAQRTSNYFKWL